MPATKPSQNDAGIDPRILLRSLRRRWFPVVALGLPLALAVATAAWFFVPAPFTARAEFYIKSFDDQLVFETAEQKAKFEIRKQTSQRLLTSRDVLTAALRDQNVARSSVLAGERDPIDWLAKNLNVASAGDEFFTLALSGDNAEETAAIVNAVTKAYIQNVVVGEQERRRGRLKDLEEIYARAKEDLEIKRQELKKLIDATHTSTTVMMEQKQNRLLELHVVLRRQLGEVQLELIKADVNRRAREGVEGADASPPLPDAIIDAYVAQEPDYQDLTNRIESLEGFVQKNRDTLGDGHPQTVRSIKTLEAAEAELASFRESARPTVVERLRADAEAQNELSDQQLDDQVTRLTLLKQELERQVESIKIQEQETGVLNLELENLDKDIAHREAMVASLGEEVDRRTFELKAPEPAIVVQAEAQVPTQRDFQMRMAVGGGGGLAAFGLVGAAFVLLDFRTRRISSVEEVSNELSLRLIGSIPAVPNSAFTDERAKGRSRGKSLFWQHALKESIDAARTLLLTEAERANLRVILVGSAVASEGKTTLTCHLATSLARTGRRVAVVDCDLRRPSLDRIFGIESEPGLSEILRGETELGEAVQATGVPGLSVIAAGNADGRTIDRLATGKIASVVAQLRQDYDFVLLDTSPILPVCDALLVAQCADAVMLAVRRDVSRLGKVGAALQRLTAVGVPVLGAVTIGLDDDPIEYGGYYRMTDGLRANAVPVNQN